MVEQTKTGKDRLLLAGIEAPEPVYFCTIEAPSYGSQKKLDLALGQLLREDPSVRITFDEQSQQNIIEAMGELHLEVIKVLASVAELRCLLILANTLDHS